MKIEMIREAHKEKLRVKITNLNEAAMFRVYTLEMLDAEYAWG